MPLMDEYKNTDIPAPIKQSTKTETNALTTEIKESVFRQDYIKYLNRYRRKHNVPPMRMTEELNTLAHEWAQVC